MLEWYFCGSLEKEYETLHHVIVNYEYYESWFPFFIPAYTSE